KRSTNAHLLEASATLGQNLLRGRKVAGEQLDLSLRPGRDLGGAHELAQLLVCAASLLEDGACLVDPVAHRRESRDDEEHAGMPRLTFADVVGEGLAATNRLAGRDRAVVEGCRDVADAGRRRPACALVADECPFRRLLPGPVLAMMGAVREAGEQPRPSERAIVAGAG